MEFPNGGKNGSQSMALRVLVRPTVRARSEVRQTDSSSALSLWRFNHVLNFYKSNNIPISQVCNEDKRK